MMRRNPGGSPLPARSPPFAWFSATAPHWDRHRRSHTLCVLCWIARKWSFIRKNRITISQ